MKTEDLLKMLEQPTVSVPVAGSAVYNLGRNSSYKAARDGKIPLIDKKGPKQRVASSWIRKMLGL
jgi:hypothetical protein